MLKCSKVLRVRIKSASGLMAADLSVFGKSSSDPYVRLLLGELSDLKLAGRRRSDTTG